MGPACGIEKSIDDYGEGPVLGGTPVWWRGPGWKSSQDTKPSRGPGAVSLASSPSGNMVDRLVGSVSKHDKCGRPAGEARDLYECVHMRVKCGLCDGSVRKKSSIQYGPATIQLSSLSTSAEGGPQSKLGRGEARKVAGIFEGAGKTKRDGEVKLCLTKFRFHFYQLLLL